MPDDMREIVTVEQVQRLFLLLAVLAPLFGAALGAAIGARQRRPGPGARTGLLIGMAGPTNLALWMLYNAITDRLGLDTVKNVLVNLAVFALIGLAAGVAWARRMQPGQTAPSATPQDREHEASPRAATRKREVS